MSTTEADAAKFLNIPEAPSLSEANVRLHEATAKLESYGKQWAAVSQPFSQRRHEDAFMGRLHGLVPLYGAIVQNVQKEAWEPLDQINILAGILTRNMLERGHVYATFAPGYEPIEESDMGISIYDHQDFPFPWNISGDREIGEFFRGRFQESVAVDRSVLSRNLNNPSLVPSELDVDRLGRFAFAGAALSAIVVALPATWQALRYP